MKHWHERPLAGLGLRAGGMVLLALGAASGGRPPHRAGGVPPRDATTSTILLAALLFLCGSAGCALLFVGPGLWERVEVSERWRRLPDPFAPAAEPQGAARWDRSQ